MNRRKFLIQLFILLMFCTSCFVTRKEKIQENNFNEVVQIAKKELPLVLDKIPEGKEELYGFHGREELLKAKVDEPFNTYTLDNNELKNASSYRIPITVDSEFRALATVEYFKESFHIVDFGANVLAKEIQQVCIENSTYNFEGILRVYSINSDFLVMSKKQENLFFPLTSAKMYLESAGVTNVQRFYTKDQIINIINKKQ